MCLQGNGRGSSALALAVPAELVDAIALRVVELLEERGPAREQPASPYLDVERAAEYIAAKPQRLYDLAHDGRLTPRRDGRRLLFLRADLDAYLEGQPS